MADSPATAPDATGWRRVAPTVFAVAWGGNHFTPLLLLYRQAEGFSPLAVDILFAGYIVGLIPGLLITGPLSDRFGRKPLLWAGIALSITASILLASGADSLVVLAIGRLIAGASVATAMGVGTSWIRDLSRSAGPGRAATRAGISLSAGFGVGAVVSGLLAQWGPIPTVLPYLVQIALCLAAAAILLPQPAPAPTDAALRSIRRDLAIPAAVRRRFFLVVVPSAPWVFGSAALAFVVTPSLLKADVGSDAIAFATLLAGLTLTAGVAVQPAVARLAVLTHGRQTVVGLGAAIVGVLIMIASTGAGSLVLGACASLLLGAGYGIVLVAGLVEVQRMAGAHHLGGITGLYYGITYLGFLLPAILAALEASLAPAVLLIGVAALIALCTAVVLIGLATTRSADPAPDGPQAPRA